MTLQRGNILRSAKDILEVTKERFKVLINEYKVVEKIETKQTKSA